MGLQHKFNGITFFNQKATKHHELLSFGLLAFSLEWLALIISFAYPTVGYFLGSSRRSILLPCTMVLQPWQKVDAMVSPKLMAEPILI